MPFSTKHTTRELRLTLVGWLKRLREPVQYSSSAVAIRLASGSGWRSSSSYKSWSSGVLAVSSPSAISRYT